MRRTQADGTLSDSSQLGAKKSSGARAGRPALRILDIDVADYYAPIRPAAYGSEPTRARTKLPGSDRSRIRTAGVFRVESARVHSDLIPIQCTVRLLPLRHIDTQQLWPHGIYKARQNGAQSVPRPQQKMFSSPASDSSSSASSSTFGSASSSSSMSSTSTRSSPVHAASLVDPALHSPALLQLVDIKLTRPVIEYVVDCVSETVDYALGRSTLAPSARGRTRSPYHAKFTTFVSTVLARAEVTPPTVLTALVYVARARPHLSIALEEWALERVFLGALIAASKYTHDSTLKNVHWALCTGVFGKRDVGRIEREFLGVLDWELGVSEADLMAHHAVLLAGSGAAVPRPRAHARHLSVPELEPSSRFSVSSASTTVSSSSASSSSPSPSPRTPAHLSPSHLAPPQKQKPDVPMDVDVELHPTLTLAPHKSGSGKLHDFMRSLHHGHGHHHHVRVAA
ncbi:hypothetical protein B0H17DRAFT_1325634 [Mycena rosella]|uniref:Cyclin N-terminal domain-containing protein n=1 Tax=Mycena rosella TaxID=1033263 RepID=A0AAD7M9I3_MYCRO|nr:hypothetical protein B0H17DRAFT_1325634 [Mycena rosella]